MQKAANIAGLGSNVRLIPTRGSGGEGEKQQQQYTLDPADLSDAMREDAAAGLTPVFVSANVGSTNTCAVDPVRALGEACRKYVCVLCDSVILVLCRMHCVLVSMVVLFCLTASPKYLHTKYL